MASCRSLLWARSLFIAYILETPLKKGAQVMWSAELECSFNELKKRVTTAPCLKLPDFSTEFEVVTDASSLALGGVLVQEGRPVAFTSRKLKTYERTKNLRTRMRNNRTTITRVLLRLLKRKRYRTRSNRRRYRMSAMMIPSHSRQGPNSSSNPRPYPRN